MERQAAIKGLECYLSNTKGFTTLKQARARIDENPQVKALITQFQKKQNALYSQKITQAQAQQAMDELNDEYERLCRTPLVNEYFQAIDQFNITMNQVIQDINASLEQKLVARQN